MTVNDRKVKALLYRAKNVIDASYTDVHQELDTELRRLENREQKIRRIVAVIAAGDGQGGTSDQFVDMLHEGFQGYENMTDEEIEQEYKDIVPEAQDPEEDDCCAECGASPPAFALQHDEQEPCSEPGNWHKESCSLYEEDDDVEEDPEEAYDEATRLAGAASPAHHDHVTKAMLDACGTEGLLITSRGRFRKREDSLWYSEEDASYDSADLWGQKDYFRPWHLVNKKDEK